MSSRIKGKPVAASRTTDTASEMHGNSNYISYVVGSLKRFAVPAVMVWQTLPRSLQVASLAVAVPLLVIPLLLAIILFPPIFLLFSVIYSSLFGFRTFINHVEDVLREYCNVSDQSLKKVHQNADILKNRAENVKGQVSANVFNFLALISYWIIMYTIRAIEYTIHKLQCAMGLLKDHGVKAKENLANKKVKSHGAKAD